MAAKRLNSTRNFTFEIKEGDHKKYFTITFNGKSWAVNTKNNFISLDEIANALDECKKEVEKK
jgi:hypothetical protein